MRTGLTKQEKTPDIWFDEKVPLIHIRTHNTALKKRLAAYRERKNRQHKEWYERQKAAQPPKPCMTVSLPQDGSAKHKKTQDGQGERIA